MLIVGAGPTGLDPRRAAAGPRRPDADHRQGRGTRLAEPRGRHPRAIARAPGNHGARGDVHRARPPGAPLPHVAPGGGTCSTSTCHTTGRGTASCFTFRRARPNVCSGRGWRSSAARSSRASSWSASPSSAGSVDATLRDAAGHEIEVSAGYVVGCDGAHSRVRHELGLAFEGQPYPNDWLLADVALAGSTATTRCAPSTGRTACRWSASRWAGHRWRLVMPNAGDRAGQAPTFDEIQDVVAQRAPWRIQVSDPRMACVLPLPAEVDHDVPVRPSAACRGRGAHPLTGRRSGHEHRDDGRPQPRLEAGAGLPAAHPRRYSTATARNGSRSRRDVLGFSDKMIGWATMRHPVKRALRDTLVPAATRLPTVQKRAARRLSQVSVGYPSSPLIRRGGAGTRAQAR